MRIMYTNMPHSVIHEHGLFHYSQADQLIPMMITTVATIVTLEYKGCISYFV